MREQSSTAAPRFGSPHRHFARVGSTNTVARELAAAGAPNGTVVTAAEQTAGRGRQGRTWTAPPGSALLYSAVLRPLEPRHSVLPLAVPLAVCETAERLRPGIDCKVKWPNDIHLEGRKLAGILIEARPQDGWAVLGIGLNLTIAQDQFPEDLQERAISLFPETSHPSREASARLSESLTNWIDADPQYVLTEWRKRDALHGREVTWENGTGVAEGIDERGYLLVRLAGGNRVALGAGDVHLTAF
jgi:BirA family biotin operon repressor/biotin-[acetyl-CoA-carboxylase] ligase